MDLEEKLKNSIRLMHFMAIVKCGNEKTKKIVHVEPEIIPESKISETSHEEEENVQPISNYRKLLHKVSNKIDIWH